MSFKLIWNPPKPTLKKAKYEWTAKHAWVVHEGGMSDNVRIYPRPWTEYALEFFIDILQAYLDLFEKYQNFDSAFVDTAAALSEAFTDAIDYGEYEYPTITVRRNGEIVGNPRNITDTGELKNSQVLTLR